MPLHSLGTRAFAVRCDVCGRSGPIVLAWRADDAESRHSAMLEAIDDAMEIGFSVSVSTENEGFMVTRSLCQRCLTRELPS